MDIAEHLRQRCESAVLTLQLADDAARGTKSPKPLIIRRSLPRTLPARADRLVPTASGPRIRAQATYVRTAPMTGQTAPA